MAEIAPFRGILYTPQAGDPSKLLAPPYDVISDAERAQLEALDPHNCVRLILPQPDGSAPAPEKPKAEAKPEPKAKPAEAKGDAPPADAPPAAKPAPVEPPADNRYQRAAATLKEWLRDGSLARDGRPAIYRYHQVFDFDGQEVVRKGFVARVRLAAFDEGVVLPHERTLAGPKVDRLHLMRAARAHFSQIFALYADRERRSDTFFEAVEQEKPALEGRTSDGVLHRVWRLTEAEAIRQVVRFLDGDKVYIADGHHRYETMLALRDELRAEGKGAGDRSAIEYGSMFFCNMDDPGLVVMATHRVLQKLPRFDRDDLLMRAREFFTVSEGPLADAQVIKRALAGYVKRGPTFAMITPGSDQIAYLRVRGDLIVGSVPAMAGQAKPLLELDVALLHGLVFESLLGIDRAAQEKQTNLRYVKDFGKAIEELRAPGVQAVFLMNPTRVEQVKAVADAGCVMPQKSTFFYPKIASGLVVNPIDPAEKVPQIPLSD
jgi:uncharacterized protein (DUF1015 family)